jgi:hypothetical protein
VTEVNYSAVFDVWEVLTERLAQIGWPLADGFTGDVHSWFGDPRQPNPDENGLSVETSPERAVVVGAVERPAVDWDTIGQLAQQEEFTATVMVVSEVPGRTSTQARDRIRDLAAAVAANIRSVQAGARDGTDQPSQFVKYPLWWWSITTTDPIVAPGPDGYVAAAEIGIACRFRINTPRIP